jgi:glycine/D-amino acid oxidase-like deaminating enzyme
MPRNYDTVICGAGITGVAAAHYLSQAGIKNILLVDERPPLSLTSNRSTECYRNWWPDPAMQDLMNRSIDLMEDLADKSSNIFRMNRRGYLYVSADDKKIPEMIERARRISALGAGDLRIHTPADSSYKPAPAEGFQNQPIGADLLLGSVLIHEYFPYLTESAEAALHIRRAGWLSAQQLGMYMLETARTRGVQFESFRVTGVDVSNGQIRSVRLNNGERVNTPIFVNASGPFIREVGMMLGVDLPVYTEMHHKTAIHDSLGVVGRDAPLLIWDDPGHLPWSPAEREALADDPDTRWLTESFPSGPHTRPEGAGESCVILLLWDYKPNKMEPRWPPPLDESFPEIALRGLAMMLPRMQEYFDKLPQPQLDGGYYTRTRENRPLIGPLGVQGAFVIGAVSGYGIMSACGVADLLTAHITGTNLPPYASAFELARYENPNYLTDMEQLGETGQL